MDNRKPDPDKSRQEYMARFAKLSHREKDRVITIAIAWLLKELANKPARDVGEFNPEQVAHANQDAIDVTFYELMADEDEI